MSLQVIMTEWHYILCTGDVTSANSDMIQWHHSLCTGDVTTDNRVASHMCTGDFTTADKVITPVNL